MILTITYLIPYIKIVCQLTPNGAQNSWNAVEPTAGLVLLPSHLGYGNDYQTYVFHCVRLSSLHHKKLFVFSLVFIFTLCESHFLITSRLIL